ncbi:TPA: hypothetical protein ACHJC8_002987 [Klebsiella pneumoniae]
MKILVPDKIALQRLNSGMTVCVHRKHFESAVRKSLARYVKAGLIEKVIFTSHIEYRHAKLSENTNPERL